jgi:glycosyltransferase involved in cell wall biosynthesis
VRVVIDARPALDPQRTGVGQYAAQVIHHLPRADPDSEYVAWYLHARGLFRPRRFFEDPGAPNLIDRASRFPARVFQPMSFRLQVPRLEWLTGGFDALLATNFLPPPTGRGGVVLVVHDLAFRVMPETAPHMDERWSRRFARWLHDSARVIVPSRATKEDLVGFEGVDEAKVVVVHHGVDAEAFAAVPVETLRAARLRHRIDGPYVLSVGGIEPRKNLVTLVRAFAELRQRDVVLVIAGGPVRWIPQEAGRLRAEVDALAPDVRRRVVLTGYVSDEDRVALTVGATAVAYPSRYEGFGFPVLEAMAAGVPVLTSNVSSLPEVAGDAAVLVDPADISAIADGLHRLLSDAGLREHLREAGRARAVTFTWHETARRTAAVLREAAAR